MILYEPWIIAHRGNGGPAPENTLSALLSESSSQCHGIECDLWKSSSGQIVITHDAEIEKHSDGKGLVFDKAYAELKDYDFAYHSPWPQFERLPCLMELLEEAEKMTWQWINLEIKTYHLQNYGIVKILKPILELFPRPDKIILSSFDLKTLLELRRNLPCFKRGFLIHPRQIPWISKTWVHSWVDAFSWHVPENLLTDSLVQAARKRKVKLLAWTVNSLEFLKKCVKYQVEGIITDKPDWVRERLHDFE